MRSLRARQSVLLAGVVGCLVACSGGSSSSTGLGDGFVDGGLLDADQGSADGGEESDGSRADGSSTGSPDGSSCAAGQAVCPKGCADLASDIKNCGSCGAACPASPAGVEGACVAGVCVQGCAGTGTLCASGNSGYCANTSGDLDNCGKCGNKCTAVGATATCQNGKCGAICPAGTVYCGSGCIDVSSDPSNCGACGTLCSNKAAAAGISSGVLSCKQSACFVTVNDEASVNCAAGDCAKSCNDVCQAKLKVPCDVDTPPLYCKASGQSGACGRYYKSFGTGPVSCDVGFACSTKIADAYKCSGSQVYIPLSSLLCQCSGVIAL